MTFYRKIVENVNRHNSAKNLEQSTSRHSKSLEKSIQNAIIELFIRERLPLAKVQSEHFTKLIDVCLQKTKKKKKTVEEKSQPYLTRWTMRRRIRVCNHLKKCGAPHLNVNS